ncbi:phage tail tube protein [Rhizobium halophytocola]|uniref:Uncharacterized protein n=1 Tax=Rhizobium halophytocola TaxID=735519 RepID=A0ABS4E416_9HYPH|nr:phage tail tube protein [Rhizobium halophytocola]MBP1852685.1 hypothetical protein [Rhizobium halophytocola]
MTTRFLRNRAILAKIEATYGTDAAPTGAANAMQMTNVTFTPLAGEEVSRDLVVPYMGHQGVFLVGSYATLSGEVEIAGAGAAGDVPAWGVLHRMCGMAEVITEDVDVRYTPVSAGFESGSIYFNMDRVNHVLLGVRGTYTINLTPKQIPRFAYTFTGLLGTITDTALPAVSLSKFVKPVPVSKANTTFALHGYAGACEGLTMDLANQIEPRFLIGAENIQQVDRMMTGQAVMEATALSEIDWFTKAEAHEVGALAAQHGKVAGNRVAFSADAVQVGRVTYGDSQKIINNTLPLMFTTEGSDEFTTIVS